MKPREGYYASILFLIFKFHSIIASPLKEPHLCGQPLCEPGKKFNYATGTKYTHKYSVDVTSLFRGTSDNTSTIYVDALVHITFLTACQGLLQVTDVTLSSERAQYNKEEDLDISGPQLPRADDFSAAISSKALRFAWHDGMVTELCPDPAEPVWVLNFKRGILSAFHNTMQRFDIDSSDFETDVNGECVTNYQLQEAKTTALVIHREKVVSTCRYRYKYHALLQTDPYNFGSSFQAVPLVKSRHRCEFSIDRKMYKTIQCEEVHTFQPLSQAENGSQAITRQSIQFLHEVITNATLPDDPLVKRTNLLFDHNATPKPISGELKASRDLLKDLCKLDKDNVDIAYPDAFIRLVHVGRRLSYSALTQIYNRAGSLCSSGRKQITDLLPFLRSNAAVAVMVENMDKVPKETAQEWLVAIGFIPRPDELTLTTFLKILNNSDHQVLLSVSALAHSFCKHHPSCALTEPVQKILAHLGQQLNSCQETLLTIEQRDHLLISLKAVGNLGVSTSAMFSSMQHCVLSDARDMEIRTAAVAANRRLQCLPSRDFFLDVYRNATYESELRIASYLQVMRCPNYHTISLIRQQLDLEEVNQVGSFVWSHLQNQLTSSMPTKVEVQTLLTDRLLNDKFNKDHRKFSRSYETSMFFDEFNAGGNIESHIIFSPKSYLPRTVMTNLTLDLFGETINVVEMEARVEGLEHLVEAVFGPSGPISATKVNTQVDRVLRLFRSATHAYNMADKLNEIPNVIDNNFKVPKMALGYKVFGNEIFYSSVTGHQEFWQIVDKFNMAKRLKQLLSGQEIVVDKASLFLEGDYIVPTGVGFPVSLSIQGTSAMNLNVVGNVKNLDPLALDVDGKLKPSIAVEITGQMGVDAYYASTGVKLKASIYTSTAVEGHVKVEGKNKATVSFNLPKEKGEVITATTRLIVMKGDREEEQLGLAERRVSTHACSWNSLDQTLGLKACVDAAFPNATTYANYSQPLLRVLGPPTGNLTDLTPSFLLSGPSHLAVGIFKADPTAERYVLHYLWNQQGNTTAISLVFDTPGSKQRRELSAKLLLDNQSKNITLLLQGVDNKFEAHGKYKFTPKEKYLGFSLDINGKKHIIAQIGLRTNAIKRGFHYQPRLYLAINSERVVELSGSVNATEKKDITLYEVKLDFMTKKLTMKLAGYISRGQANWSTKMTCNYRFASSGPQRLSVELRVGNTSSKSLTQYNGALTVQSTSYSYLNFESSLKYQRAQGHAEATLVVNTRPELKDDRYKFTSRVGFSVRKSADHSSLNAFIEASKPISNIDLRLGISFNGQSEKSTTYLTVRYATGKEATASLVLAMPRSDLLKFDGKLNVTLPGFVPMVIVLELDEKKLSEYDIGLEAVWFSGHNLTATGVYVDKSEGLLKSYSLKLFVQSPSFNSVTLLAKFLSDEDQFKLDLQAEHMEDKYAVSLKHATYGEGEMEAYAEVRYKSSLYTVNTLVNLKKNQRIFIEAHLDKYRDINILLSGDNQERKKEVGIEVKWDANRDPGQKFAGQIRFEHPKTLMYSVDASATYPGRKVVALAEFSVQGTKFDSGMRLEWSPSDILDVRAGAVYNTGNYTNLRVTSQLLTPFPGWKRTSLSAGIHSIGNLMQANGSVWWQDDRMVGVNVYWDYSLPESVDKEVLAIELDDADNVVLEKLLHIYFSEMWCAFNASLLSTVSEVRPLHASLSHRQQRNSLDTHIHWQGRAGAPVTLRSKWQVGEVNNGTEVIGNVTLTSPYEGYERGIMLGRLYYSANLNIDGYAELNIDRKEYYGTIKGHVKSLRDNMLVVNVTTPIPQLSEVTGRIGYSEAGRHLVCMWTMPNSSLGTEVRLVYFDSNDFDVLLHVATPLDFFNKLLLLGKRKEDMVDFRIGFNQLLLGVVGSWHYAGITDLDYQYTLYTPVQGFQETTMVAKILILDGADVDLRLRVAGVKVGVTVLWIRKKSGLRRPMLKLVTDPDELVLENNKATDVRWRGACVLDTHVYPTITGDLIYDRAGNNILVEANLALPQGHVYLYDEFYLKDVFNIKNDLQLVTPFAVCPEITSVLNFHLILLTDVHLEFELHVRAANVTKKGGLLVRYKRDGPMEDEDYDEEMDGPVIHAATVHCHTPWLALPLLRASTVVQYEDTTASSNFTVLTNTSWFTIAAVSLSDKDYKKLKVRTMMASPSYKLPEVTIEGKQDFSSDETVFELAAKCPELALSYAVNGRYSYVPETQLKVEGLIETSSQQLRHLLFAMAVVNKSDVLYLHGKLHNQPNLFLEVNGLRNGTTLSGKAESMHVASAEFEGMLDEMDSATAAYSLQGLLTVKANNQATQKWDEAVYNVDTGLTLQQPIAIEVTLTPQTEGVRSILLEISSTHTESDSTLNASLTVGREAFKLNSGVVYLENEFVSLNADARSSLSILRDVHSAVSLGRGEDSSWDLALEANTPHQGARKINIKGNIWSNNYSKRMSGAVNTDLRKGQLRCEYSWLEREDLAGLVSGTYQASNKDEYHVHTEAFFRHPGQNLKLISTGLDIEIDRLYRFGANATLSCPSEGDVALNMNLKLPRPGDVHSIAGKLLYTPKTGYVAHALHYTSLEELQIAGSSGEMSMNQTEVGGNIKVEWGNRNDIRSITNVLLYKRPNASHVAVHYNLHTPYFPEDTVVVRVSGRRPADVWDVTGHLFAPRSRQLTDAKISYLAVNNVNATMSSKTPFPKVPEAAVDFQVISHNSGHFRRHLILTWPNNTAVVKSDHWDVYTMSERRVRDMNGQILVEIPLATRLVANASYTYQDAYPKSSGECIVNYLGAELLSGRFGCLSEERAGFSKDDMDISVQNKLFPLGARYIHQFQYDGTIDDTGALLSTDRKWADVYRLDNKTAFNVMGELRVKTLETGKEIKVSATQANTTVDVDTDYHFLDHQFTHSTKLSLAPTIWVSYYLDIVNKTTDSQEEGNARLDVAYPAKNFTLSGHLRQDARAHESELRLDWNRPHNPRTIGAGLDWWRASRKPDQQVATLRLKHPTFVKDVTFNSTYIRQGMKSFKTRVEVEYSDDAEKKLIVEGSAQDHSVFGHALYQVDVLATHPATRLDLAARGTVAVRPVEYGALGNARYKRSFLGQQNGHVLARIDGNAKALIFEKRLQHEESYFKARLYTEDPCCTRINGSLAKTQVLNYSANFLLDVDKKLLLAVVNMTEDGNENLRAHGYIPDSRFAELNVWRTYDDLTVSDIACYLRLNHSRLVTSRLKWRPTLRKEILEGLEEAYLAVLKNLDDTVDYWKDYIRSEVKEAIIDVYQNSKSDVQQFLDDLEDLKTLENDVESMRQLLNESYNRNDFYVKDVVVTVLLLVDELALKKHMGAVPAVLTDLWQSLGETGDAVRRSLAWIIETVKNSYRKAMELFHQLLHGDSGAKLSSLLEEWIARYDKTVKELQMTVLRHIEQLYTSITDSLSSVWANLLRAIEPTYIQIIHYMEQVAYSFSHDVLDFLYERESELRESPFFLRIANLTQDLDRFHEDLISRDIFTNIHDYSTRFYNTFRDRYLPRIPFGKEVHQVVTEIVEGFQELEKLPSINYLIKKRNEVAQRLVWFWQSLDLGSKLQKIATIVQKRILDASASALQSENKYREAKTKFIFEPMQGLVLLEQKLPMSWHAFNETPRFEEVPEYRALAVLQNQLTLSNKTFWAFYYEYKPGTEIANWFPPFKAQAIIMGSQHLLTFDGKFLSFRGDCDYLLARDFVNGNFSLIMQRHFNSSKTDQFLLSLVTPLHTITIDIFNDEVTLPKGMSLPAQFGSIAMYKEHGVFTIEERDGYILQCNTLFQVCTLSLTGWYYGKTAGLLGTMDHEVSTDLLTSHGHVVQDVGVFARSWAINQQECAGFANKAYFPSDPPKELVKECAALFQTKSSHFAACFGLVNPAPFLKMCVASQKEKCSAAAAYVQACQTQYTLITVPDTCVTCKTVDGKIYNEGDFIKLSDELVPQSADVVFVVEAKACNANMTTHKNMGILLDVLDRKLQDVGLTNNRYGAVVFGGDGVYDSPRALLADHEASSDSFSSAADALKAFQRFQVGNGTEDIFDGIAYASTLQFRPGVSKIFVVIPCSSCDPSRMAVEYSVLRQVLLENNVRLHMLMNDDFEFKKKRLANSFYGIDNLYAYTKKERDAHHDKELRLQAKIPKSFVAFCAPLALETNGTVFAAKWLVGEKANSVSKFAGVLGKRVASSAAPAKCQTCECSSFDTGMGYMNCEPCDFPTAANPQLGPDEYGDDEDVVSDLDDYNDNEELEEDSS